MHEWLPAAVGAFVHSCIRAFGAVPSSIGAPSERLPQAEFDGVGLLILVAG
jgi:hypothetical protein